MRKFRVFLSVIFITVILAGVFGILHDEITYSISPEYFTKFKLLQFHIGEAVPYRLGAAHVGLMATWWTGLIIGLILGLTGFLFPDYKMMRKYVWKGIAIIFCITICIAFLGFLFGKFYLANHPPQYYYYPADLIDKKSFIIVGTIHNASYLGGLVGLMAAVIYIFSKTTVLQTSLRLFRQIER